MFWTSHAVFLDIRHEIHNLVGIVNRDADETCDEAKGECDAGLAEIETVYTGVHERERLKE